MCVVSFYLQIMKKTPLVVLVLVLMTAKALAQFIYAGASQGTTGIISWDLSGNGSIIASGYNNVVFNFNSLAADEFANVYATATGKYGIYKITSGGALSLLTSGYNGTDLIFNSLAVDSATNIYASVQGATGIYKTTTDGITSLLTSGYNGSYLTFNSLATDKSGNIYSTASGWNGIFKTTPSGDTSLFYGLGRYQALAVDEVGDIFAAGATAGITKFTPDGTPSVFTSYGLITSLDVDSSGNLWGLNNHRIQEYAPDGSTIISQLNSYGTFTALVVVPEPASIIVATLLMASLLVVTRVKRSG
jgi:hypothetical protein